MLSIYNTGDQKREIKKYRMSQVYKYLHKKLAKIRKVVVPFGSKQKIVINAY